MNILMTLLIVAAGHAATYSPEHLEHAAQLWRDIVLPPPCASLLERRRTRARWLRGLGPARRAIHSFRKRPFSLEGPTLGDPDFQSLLDGTLFDHDARPVLLTGDAAEGKSVHLLALERYLAARGRSYVSLTDRLHRPLDPREPLRLGIEVRASADLAERLRHESRAWTIAEGAPRQQILAGHIMEMLQVHHRALKNVVVIVDPSLVGGEDPIDADLPTSLNLLDRVAWVGLIHQIKFVVAVRPEVIDDLGPRAARQGTNPHVLADYRRLSLGGPTVNPKLTELSALFPGRTFREITRILLDYEREVAPY